MEKNMETTTLKQGLGHPVSVRHCLEGQGDLVSRLLVQKKMETTIDLFSPDGSFVPSACARECCRALFSQLVEFRVLGLG